MEPSVITDLIQQCREEQLKAATHLQANPNDRYLRVWLDDWFAEEMLLSRRILNQLNKETKLHAID